MNTISKSIAAGALLLVAAEVSAAELVVIESNAPTYVPGRTFDAASPLVLANQQFVVLATEDGQVLRFDGPRNAPIASTAPQAEPPPAEVVGALARLFGPRGPELGGIAGVRGGANDDVADERPDPWLIHAERTSDQCFIPGRLPTLWREVAGTVGSEIEDVVAHATVRFDWAPDRQRATWPAALSPQSGRVYLVRPENAITSVAIRLQAVPGGLGDDDLASVAWLAAKGCTAQARLLLDRIVAKDPV